MEALLSGFACAPGLQSLRLGASLVLSLTETTNCSADCHPGSPSYHSHSKHHSRATPHSAPSSWSLRCQGRAGSPWKGRASSFPQGLLLGNGRLCILSRLHGCCVLSCFSHVWLCAPVDCSPPGSSVHGVLQARILEWVAISFSRGSCWPRDWTQVSCTAGGFTITELARKPCVIVSCPYTGLWYWTYFKATDFFIYCRF